MKKHPTRHRMDELRSIVEDPCFAQFERALNNAKGMGGTPLLLKLAQEKSSLMIVFPSEKAIEMFQDHPAFSKLVTYQKLDDKTLAIFDNSTVWELLRKASLMQAKARLLLDWMELKRIGE